MSEFQRYKINPLHCKIINILRHRAAVCSYRTIAVDSKTFYSCRGFNTRRLSATLCIGVVDYNSASKVKETVRKLKFLDSLFVRIKYFSQIALICLVLLLLFHNAHSLYGSGKSCDERFDISAASSFNIKKGIEPNIFYFDILGQYFSRFAKISVGMQFTSANTDVLLKAMFTPLNTLHHTIGLGSAYHFSHLYNVGSIHDLLASFEYTLVRPHTFIFFAQMGYMHQWIIIPVPRSRTIVIDQPSITMAFHFTGIIKKEWYIGGGISSYEIFRYPVFANPSLGVDLYYRSDGQHFPKGFYLGLEGILRYSDLFTFSGYPENFIIKSVIGMNYNAK